MQQAVRLRYMQLVQGEDGVYPPVEHARSFDQLLTSSGVEHEYQEVKGGDCDIDMMPVLQNLSDHLAGE